MEYVGNPISRWQFLDSNFRALYTDSCLYLVPGTHKALRTPEQKALSLDPTTPPANPLDMPGAIQITLQRLFIAFEADLAA